MRIRANLGHFPPVDAQDSLGDLCGRMEKNPSSTEVSAASSAVAHAVATATATTTNKPSSAGAKDMAALGGVLGAAVVVAAVI